MTEEETRELVIQKITNLLRGSSFTVEYKVKKKPQGVKIICEVTQEQSNEDEKELNTTISFLDDFKSKGYENAVACIDWLESLKQRITKQE